MPGSLASSGESANGVTWALVLLSPKLALVLMENTLDWTSLPSQVSLVADLAVLHFLGNFLMFLSMSACVHACARARVCVCVCVCVYVYLYYHACIFRLSTMGRSMLFGLLLTESGLSRFENDSHFSTKF